MINYKSNVIILTLSLPPIFYPVSSPVLRGTSDVDQALVQQYINFADNEILPPACTWVFPTQGLMQYNKEVCLFNVYSY